MLKSTSNLRLTMATQENLTLCVPRASTGANPLEPVLVSSPKPSLSGAGAPENHILIKVDRFGYSTNKYFDFHAAPTTTEPPVSPETHGVIPVWSFGMVEASTHPDIKVGERVYGYFAPTRYLLLPIATTEVNRRPYNQVTRCSGDPTYHPSPAIEDLTMLYRPLFWTAFWCEDWLYTGTPTPYRGVKNVLISSASSKTAFCVAYNIKKRLAKDSNLKLQIVGITSKKNREFTKGLGLYDTIYEYDEVNSIPSSSDAEGSWIYADVAGNDELNGVVVSHLGSRLLAGIALGLTNLSPTAPGETSSSKWTANKFDGDAAHAASSAFKLEQFFMPEWLTKRRAELEQPVLMGMMGAGWGGLMKDCPSWVKMHRVYGGEACVEAYKQFGKAAGPDAGWVWSLWNSEEEAK
ncbi:hypothetical protein HWV62_9689 [Athelia sp. TMB]|nr:hypothetical protein HWV62_9689 [Athelia sp. TMB]